MRRQVLLHLGLERKERLLGTKAPCQGPIEEDLAEMTMNTEEGRQGTAGPNRHQRGPLFQAPIFAQHLRQLLNRRRFEECGQGNSLAKRTLDESEQTHRQERMSAQPEEVVLDADGLDLQYPFPDLGQLSFQLVPGRRLSFPLGVNGSASRVTKEEGTMYAGSFSLRKARNSPAERAGRASGTQ